MQAHSLSDHTHHHETSLDSARSEARTRVVVWLTVVMMVAELVGGYVTGSMALLADGWHMATDAGALALALAAYWYARTHAGSEVYSFGTGKVYALAGYSSAIALAMIAIWMMVEAVLRLLSPEPIIFAQALPVAALGLVVNLASVLILGGAHGHAGHDHGAGGDHAGHDHAGHDHTGHDHAGHDHAASKPALGSSPHADHNLRAAYLHVIADAVTSVTAIGALLGGRYFGWWFLDPLMGILGGVVILRWSVSLCRSAARTLLDATPIEKARELQAELERIDDVRVADLHLWEMAPGRRGCIVSLVTSEPRDTAFYRDRILAAMPLAHLTIEVTRCDSCSDRA